MFWVRTQSGSLVNIAQCIAIQRVKDPIPNLFIVQALDVTESGSFILAKGLTEENADALMTYLWRAIPVEDSFDVKAVVK